MRFSLLVALVATVSTTAAAAATTSTRRTSTTKTSSAATHTSSATLNYWWSYHAENNTESYDPAFEICGSSCADCWDGARSCFAQEFSNICYEPGRGETCCKDKYGSMYAFELAVARNANMRQRAVTRTSTARTPTMTSPSAVLMFVDNSSSVPKMNWTNGADRAKT